MSCISSPTCMMTPESDVDSPLAISPSVQGSNLRVIIRHLLDRYDREEIDRLVAEEASSSPTGRADAASSQRSQRDSLSPQSAALNHGSTCGPTQASNSRRTISSNTSSSQRSQRQETTSDGGSTVPRASQRLDYACGLCAEENIRKTCTRRNDLRRHIENFHNRNAVWYCQHPGCEMAYDWQSAYQIHLRTAHGRSHMNVDEAMVRVCPQTVFACGFEECTRVFESCSEDDAATALKEFSGHVVKHFEEGSKGSRWNYSTRIRNLLRQAQVSAVWETAWPEMERPRLQWQTQTSLGARKILEAGHLEQLPFLIRCLIILGSDGGDLSKSEGRLEPPVRNRCPAPYRHRLPLDTQAQSPLQQDLEREMKQFHVSGGHIGPEYRSRTSLAPDAYRRMQPAQQVSRPVEAAEAVEVFHGELVEGTVGARQAQQAQQAQQSNHSNAGGASLRPHTPPHQLFYHGPTSSAMFRPSRAKLPAGLQPLQQQYAAVTQEADTKSVMSPAGFQGMQPVTADLGSCMDMDMAGDSSMNNYHDAAPFAAAPADVPPSRACWMGHYSLMAMPASSLSSEGYVLSSECTTRPETETNRSLEHFDSAE
ncbi:hypothetical protein E4U42_005110 [Claviceps africana]|uniref:C2H2-type domain-containing protein n=1 Tax=Claviceps africana TaxID=83212 RepID=A0A8K0JD84_9HYPO|nr:hypothetical protein E4U42_005110 [Claviceps africana]